jgi:hypothetical protein
MKKSLALTIIISILALPRFIERVKKMHGNDFRIWGSIVVSILK